METLRERTAAELRAALGRRRISASELARRLGWSQPYTARRVDGRIALDMDDLEQIENALGIDAADLMPKMARPNNRSAALTVRPMSARRRDVTRPKGRGPAKSTRPVSAVPANKRRPQPVGSPNRPMAA